MMRRQLACFLPPDQGVIVESVRQELDPWQHAIIPAHVTLCRDDELVPWEAINQRLECVDEFSLTMHFGEPLVLSDGCVLLRPTRGMEQYQHLRQLILGSSAKTHGAHITLLHPRNATGVVYKLADIASMLTGLAFNFRTFALIEQDGAGRWAVRQEYGLPSDRSLKPSRPRP